MRFIVTGGCGYIGSHLVKRLFNEGHKVIVIENLSTDASKLRLPYVNYWADIYNADLVDEQIMEILAYNVKQHGKIDGVFHLAALTSVPESIKEPDKYLLNNIRSTVNICKYFDCPILFSSSCAVYGNCKDYCAENGISELSKMDPQSPYAKSKAISELAICANSKSYIILRYFNPIGCEMEELKDVCKSRISASLRNGIINIYGNQYNTIDGTAVRDYIHISDLIDAHLSAFGKLLMRPLTINNIYNIGTGKGISVYQLCDKYRMLVNSKLIINIGNNREGDVDKIWADPSNFMEEFGWKPKKTIDDMIIDIM